VSLYGEVPQGEKQTQGDLPDVRCGSCDPPLAHLLRLDRLLAFAEVELQPADRCAFAYNRLFLLQRQLSPFLQRASLLLSEKVAEHRLI